MHFQILVMMLIFSFPILSMDNESFSFYQEQDQGDSSLNQQEDSYQEKRKKPKVEATKKWDIDYEAIYKGRAYLGKLVTKNNENHLKAIPKKRTKKAQEPVKSLEQKKN